ncbi:hypothetical protein N0B16_13705 [Chryseobacterium sp. GMJ5]|uniref:Fibrobacter succinogenes major paralogous domain-containing protein n=1 Tax=Chryseobacterium gilvum TaxID=2976534 RepID=A0ABT2W0P5_9FLAO|nr:hypothetical protein [Chryseobacterium gilvum]MCU7615488.1 hypothetical protein [Chryseobacterium gilvum]
MNKYIITLCLFVSGQIFSQITIGKSAATLTPASAFVSIEFGDAAGGQKGIVLPWVTSEAVLGGTTPAPITGTLFFDSATKKIKFGSSTTSGATAISQYIDLSAGALTPAAGVGVADTNAEISTAKMVISSSATVAATNTTSGIMVLADTDKAMVLPRVNSYTDIVNPSPGMMVYVTGTTPDQLAVFNGSEWSFWDGVQTVTSATTGRVWMDRNLGATQVATALTDAAAYGSLYQWGRLTDGHQVRTSATTATLSTTDVPGNGNFITNGTAPNDWRSTQNNNLWQGIGGINNPCPNGFRIPTLAEFIAEGFATGNAAFASVLKLPAAGVRSTAGAVSTEGTNGNYYTSTISGTSSSAYTFTATTVATSTVPRATGASVRCIKN